MAEIQGTNLGEKPTPSPIRPSWNHHLSRQLLRGASVPFPWWEQLPPKQGNNDRNLTVRMTGNFHPLIHGNPQPSFLEVVTHILGVKTYMGQVFLVFWSLWPGHSYHLIMYSKDLVVHRRVSTNNSMETNIFWFVIKWCCKPKNKYTPNTRWTPVWIFQAWKFIKDHTQNI